MIHDVLIVGAGHAGGQAAIALRQFGFQGAIALLGEEHEPPYERPPLSKEYLAGQKSREALALRPPSFWSDRSIDFIGGETVVSIDPWAHVVYARSGRSVAYRQLIWAAGGHARQLGCPGSHLAGVHAIRTRAGVDALRADLANANRVTIVGGGYIGLEAAAVLRKLGKRITLLEALPRVLARVAGEPLSRFFEAEHRAQGVDLRTGAVIEALEGGRRIETIRLADGTSIAVDVVIVGIGILPSTLPLLEAGAEGGDGVSVDEHCRTTLPDIFAVGDCALHQNRFARGTRIRIESVQNASDMAIIAARAIAGDPAPYRSTPWFWSNQYDLKLQTVGLSTGYDDTVLRGDPGKRCFSLIYLREGAVIAVDCVNRVKDYVQGRALVEANAEIAPELLADADIALNALL